VLVRAITRFGAGWDPGEGSSGRPGPAAPVQWGEISLCPRGRCSALDDAPTTPTLASAWPSSKSTAFGFGCLPRVVGCEC